MALFQTNMNSNFDAIARVIVDAGGLIVGRTRLQKTVYLLKLAGYDEGFNFRYKHYGPFSDALAETATVAAAFDKITEDQRTNTHGETYFQYTAKGNEGQDPNRVSFTRTLASIDAILLELAATAVYLHLDGYKDAWLETAKRKPDKAANGRLIKSKQFYEHLSSMQTLQQLPDVL